MPLLLRWVGSSPTAARSSRTISSGRSRDRTTTGPASSMRPFAAGRKASLFRHWKRSPTDGWILNVDDTQRALEQWARWKRRHFTGIVIGVTGSVGKTTTRQMIHTVLQSRLKGTASPRNYNNQWGVPLSMLTHRTATRLCRAGVGRQPRRRDRHAGRVVRAQGGRDHADWRRPSRRIRQSPGRGRGQGRVAGRIARQRTCRAGRRFVAAGLVVALCGADHLDRQRAAVRPARGEYRVPAGPLGIPRRLRRRPRPPAGTGTRSRQQHGRQHRAVFRFRSGAAIMSTPRWPPWPWAA